MSIDVAIYDYIAEVYRIDTGHMAPGKSAPLGSYEDNDLEENRLRFNRWNDEHKYIVKAMTRAFREYVENQ